MKTTDCSLTDNFVKKLRPVYDKNGKVKQVRYWDKSLKGFFIRISASSKTFYMKGHVGGKPVVVTLGTLGNLTPDEARKKARKAKTQMDDGENPNLAKKAARSQGVTFQEAFNLLLDSPKKGGATRSPKTVKEYRKHVDAYLSDWLNRPLVEISREEVNTRHKKIAKDAAKRRGAGRGGYSANGALRVFRAAYNRAMRQHPELQANPCINIDWFQEKPKQNPIPQEQLATWYADRMAMENTIHRDYLIFVLLTGLRKTSALVIKKEHINFKEKTLFIPEPKGGTEKAFTLPLTDFHIELLKNRINENEDIFPNTEFVFPAKVFAKDKNSKRIITGQRKRNGKTVNTYEMVLSHLAEPNLRDSGFSVHDLRHTFSTMADSIGIFKHDVALLLNHTKSSTDVTARYIHATIEKLRPLMEMITDHIVSVAQPDNKKVVSFSKAKNNKKN